MTWRVLLAPVALACGLRANSDAIDAAYSVAGVPIVLPDGPANGDVVVKHKWLLALKKDLSQARIHEIQSSVLRVGFHAKHANAMEYLGTKEQLEADLQEVGFNNDVRYVELDSFTGLLPEVPDLTPNKHEFTGAWGLQRIGADRRTGSGEGIHCYVLDTGIAKHPAFGNRVVRDFDITSALDSSTSGACSEIGLDTCSVDKHGHGTHVAGKIAGEGTGVAPKAILHSMKVLNDKGTGKLSWLVRAFNHIFDPQRTLRDGFLSKTLIATLSVQTRGNYQLLNEVIDSAVRDHGVVVVVAAGNMNVDACGAAPANLPSVLTVGATDKDSNMASFSNFGSCVNILAPGASVQSLHAGKMFKNTRMSGTSLAMPHVAGVMALMLQETPSMDVEGVTQRVLTSARTGAIQGDLKGSPNLELSLGESEKMAPCDTSVGYADVKGWGCSTWRWNWFGRCSRGGPLYHYSDMELENVKTHCPVACGKCGWSLGLPQLR